MQPAIQFKIAPEDFLPRLHACDVPLVTDRRSVCVDTRDYAEALAACDEAVHLDPENTDAYVALAWLLATHPDKHLRDGQRAINLARRALALGSAHPALLETLAAAYAEAGDYEQAVFWRTESLDASAG